MHWFKINAINGCYNYLSIQRIIYPSENKFYLK